MFVGFECTYKCVKYHKNRDNNKAKSLKSLIIKRQKTRSENMDIPVVLIGGELKKGQKRSGYNQPIRMI